MHTIIFRSIRFRFLIAIICIALLGQGIVVRPALAKTADAPRQVIFANNIYPNCRLATVSWSSPKKAFVFAVATDGTIWSKAFNGSTSTWDGWTWHAAPPVSGRQFTCIGAASWATGRIDIFGVDNKSYVWHRYLDVGNAWGPVGTWEALGSPIASISEFPTGIQVVSWGSNRLDAFLASSKSVTGGFEDSSYHLSWNPNSGWSSWESVANGNVSTWGVNRLDIVGTWFNSYNLRTDVARKYFNGTNWLPPYNGQSNGEDLAGGSVWKYPFSISRVESTGTKRLDIFARDYTTNAIRYKTWTGSSWNDWSNLGGGFSGATSYMPITGVSPASNRLDIFEVRGGSSTGVYHRKYLSGTWSSWEYIGGEYALNYVKASSWSSSRIDLFAIRSNDGSLWHLAWDGSAWKPSINGWEYIGN